MMEAYLQGDKQFEVGLPDPHMQFPQLKIVIRNVFIFYKNAKMLIVILPAASAALASADDILAEAPEGLVNPPAPTDCWYPV